MVVCFSAENSPSKHHHTRKVDQNAMRLQSTIAGEFKHFGDVLVKVRNRNTYPAPSS
jgi:hypothetical protein